MSAPAALRAWVSRRPCRRLLPARLAAQRGLTLLELLVSLAIVAILAAAQAAPFQRALTARDQAETAMERSSAARLTLQRLAEELTGAVALPGERFRFSLVDRTLDRPASELRFTTSSARRVRSGATDPLEVIRYALAPGEAGSEGGVLVKEQLPSVAAEGTPPATYVVLEDVAAFTVRVLPDRGEPLAAWQGGEGGVQIPRAVELRLALADGTPAPPVYRLLVDIPMGGRSQS